MRVFNLFRYLIEWNNCISNAVQPWSVWINKYIGLMASITFRLLNGSTSNINMLACNQYRPSEAKFCCSFLKKVLAVEFLLYLLRFRVTQKALQYPFFKMLLTKNRSGSLAVFIVQGVLLLFASLRLLEAYETALTH